MMSRKHPKAPKNQQSPAQPQPQGGKETTHRHVYVEPGVQIDIVHDLKEQYKTERRENQSAHKRQLFWTIIGAVILFAYTTAAFWQGWSNKKAADAAKSAATTAEDTLVVSNRPWIALQVSADGPLIFDSYGAASISLRFRLSNVGHSVAKYVGIWPQLRFGGVDLSEEDKFCGSVYGLNDVSDYGYLLFPGQAVEVTQPAAAAPKQVEEAIQGTLIKGKLIPYIFVCVDYRSALENSHHQTRLVRVLLSQNPITHSSTGAFEPHGAVYPIELVPQMHGDSAY